MSFLSLPPPTIPLDHPLTYTFAHFNNFIVKPHLIRTRFLIPHPPTAMQNHDLREHGPPVIYGLPVGITRRIPNPNIPPLHYVDDVGIVPGLGHALPPPGEAAEHAGPDLQPPQQETLDTARDASSRPVPRGSGSSGSVSDISNDDEALAADQAPPDAAPFTILHRTEDDNPVRGGYASGIPLLLLPMNSVSTPWVQL